MVYEPATLPYPHYGNLNQGSCTREIERVILGERYPHSKEIDHLSRNLRGKGNRATKL